MESQRVAFPAPARPGLRVLLDLDDTLIVTQARFDAANAAASALVASFAAGFPPVEPAAVLAAMRETDREAVRTQATFRVRRFTESWLATAGRFLGDVPPVVAEELERVTMAVWEPPYAPYAGAEAAVRALAALDGVGTISVLTVGDAGVQRQKLGSLPAGMAACLTEAVVVHRKDAEAMRYALDGHPAGHALMAGNSLRSDIEPALAAGLWAVHVDQDSWVLDAEHSADLGSDRFLRVPSISLLPEAVGRVLSRQ